jgi:two-component system response regulator RegX3
VTSKPSILVVEDEAPIREGVCDVLAFRGYRPVPVADGHGGLSEALSGRHALVMLDVMLPGLDGFSICERVRQALPRQAILMLTAKGGEDDVLEGFRRGADDYVPKPFSVAQLVARVQALVRRTDPAAHGPLDLGGLVLDPKALVATGPGGVVELSLRDVEVILYLAGRRGEVVSRADLLRDVWGYARAEALETRCVDIHLSKLRRKLGPTGLVPIETVRGAGYRVPR